MRRLGYLCCNLFPFFCDEDGLLFVRDFEAPLLIDNVSHKVCYLLCGLNKDSHGWDFMLCSRLVSTDILRVAALIGEIMRWRLIVKILLIFNSERFSGHTARCRIEQIVHLN